MSRRIREKGLIQPTEHVVLAVSGGPDSVSMARAFASLRYRISIAWVDHGHRPSARLDGELVARLAASLNAPFISLCASPTSVSEAGLRDARYAELSALAGDCIATAHTANDQAETVLMRMIRGTGISGLSGIPDRRGRFVRPLLGMTRKDVLTYLDDLGQEYAIDPTNASLEPLRNRVRHVLLPMLEAEFQPRISVSLQRLAEAARIERNALEVMAAQHIAVHGNVVEPMRRLPQGLRIHVIRGLCPVSTSQERAAAVDRLVCGVIRGEVQLEEHVVASVVNKKLAFKCEKDAN